MHLIGFIILQSCHDLKGKNVGLIVVGRTLYSKWVHTLIRPWLDNGTVMHYMEMFKGITCRCISVWAEDLTQQHALANYNMLWCVLVWLTCVNN